MTLFVSGLILLLPGAPSSRQSCRAGEPVFEIMGAKAHAPENVPARLLGAPSLDAYLKASNTGAGDEFGHAIAVSGDTLVVGAWEEDSSAVGVGGNQANNGAADSGAVYVFVYESGEWNQQAYIKASNTQSSDWFGSSVAISGDTLVVGALGEDSNATGVNGLQTNNSASISGAAYVFVRSGTVWSQQAYLKASNTNSFDRFGCSVAISGDTIVVGATHEDSNATGVNGNQADNSASGSGAAYVFTRSGAVWSQQAYLKASNTGIADKLGWAVAADGDTVVVGAYFEASNSTGVNGNQADDSADNAGAAYVFVRSDAVWTQQAYLKASNTEAFDQFGYSVALAGDTAVVGAVGEASNSTAVDGHQADNSFVNSGAAYVFARSGGDWSQQAYLKASNTDEFDQFGASVAVSGDLVLVGAPFENDGLAQLGIEAGVPAPTGAGAAYLFERAGSVWSHAHYITASNREAEDEFGHAVTLDGLRSAVAAPLEDSSAVGADGNQADNSFESAGAAYSYSLVPCPNHGDMNCDCAVDMDDVDPFVLALLDATAYDTAYPSCEILNADILTDGNVDSRDTQGFVDLLVP